MKKFLVLGFIFLVTTQSAFAWGFWAHKRINRLAVFTLPPGMFLFYKTNIEYLTEHAVDPDKRRYAVEGEAPRHYIDLDHYCIYPCEEFPKSWFDAKEKYSVDTLETYGTVPWTIEWMTNSLTQAFKDKDKGKILKYSSDIGHYIGDSHVPLHTTENYNGQLTDQYGIHGFWESRLPELFYKEYDFFVGKANYISDRNAFIWTNVLNAHSQLEEVLSLEKQLDSTFASDQKYSFEARGTSLIKTYSFEYSSAYHTILDGMVERQMQLSIKHVGDLWYTCWVNAGMPSLDEAKHSDVFMEEEDLEPKNGIIKTRKHPKNGIEAIEIPYED